MTGIHSPRADHRERWLRAKAKKKARENAGFKCSGEDSNRPAKTLVQTLPAFAGGNHSGNNEPNSTHHNAFFDRLKASGFTPSQVAQIGDALRQSGLEIVATEPASE